MQSRHINLDFKDWKNLNNQIIPPPKDYPYLYGAIQYPFDSKVTENSGINAWWLAELATLAYESRSKVIEELNKLQNIRFVWLDESNLSSTDGFFVEFETFAVVAFRGTEFPKLNQLGNLGEIQSFLGDMVTDSTVLNDAELKGTKVHKGINDELNLVWEELYELLEGTQKQVWFTGHSLGGALAILGAFKWNNPLKVGGVYTIGSPAIGNHEFKRKYNLELDKKTFRYIYGNDFVTDIAKLATFVKPITNFEQVGQAKYLSSDIDWPWKNRFSFMLPSFLTSWLPSFTVLSIVEHGPILYLNSLWNNLIEGS